MTRFPWIYPSIAAALLLAGISPAYAQNQTVDAPQRVARMAYATGDVEFAPAGTDTWGTASQNRPLITGDRLLTSHSGRAALELGDAAARIDHDSAFSFLRLDQQVVQIELSRGTMNLRVRQIYGQQVYEIDTPALAFVASQPGSYRIDVAPDGRGAMVTVFEGSGMVYGTDNTQRSVNADHQYRFNDSDVSRATLRNIPRGNAFDRFCDARDARYADSISRRYVADNVVGYSDLDRYGTWQSSAQYDHIWYPRNVATNWAPYRDGHWAWIDPWGWTWVDNAPWGFAPFHYGRWAYVGSRWGWVPGPRARRAVYAPALVAFVGGSGFSVSISSGRPVGWFPLGPRDVYLPPYRVSRSYFTAVNVTNIRVVNRTVINHYYNDYHNHQRAWRDNYTYRNHRNAVTVVPRSVFTGAKPVSTGALRLRPDQLANTAVALRPSASPRNASLGVMPRGRPGPSNAAFDRKVIARHTPAPTVIPYAKRIKAVAKHGGTPLTSAQRQTLRATDVAAHPRVEVLKRIQPRGAPATATRNHTPDNTPAKRNAPRGIPMPSTRTPVHAPTTSHDRTPASTPSKRAAPRGIPMPSTRTPVHAPTTSHDRTPASTPSKRAAPRGIPMPSTPTPVRAPTTSHDHTPASTPSKRTAPRGIPMPPRRTPTHAPATQRATPAPHNNRRQVRDTPPSAPQRRTPPVPRTQQRQPPAREPVHRAPPPVIERHTPAPRPQHTEPAHRATPHATPAPKRSTQPRGKPAKTKKAKPENTRNNDNRRVHIR